MISAAHQKPFYESKVKDEAQEKKNIKVSSEKAKPETFRLLPALLADGSKDKYMATKFPNQSSSLVEFEKHQGLLQNLMQEDICGL